MLTQNQKAMITDFKNLGVKQGDVLLLHTSIKGLHTVGLTPAEIIESLTELLTEKGSLLVPALSYQTVTREHPLFDLRNTQSCIGALPEYFRLSYATHRSFHPTHSVCALGRFAKELTKDHYLDNTPVGIHSPFRMLPAYHGKILMLGCTLRPCTFMHGVEEAASAPYPLAKEPMTYTMIDEAGKEIKKDYFPHAFGSLIQRYDRLEQLISPPWLVKGRILNGTGWLLDAEKTMEIASEKIKEESCFFVDSANA